MENTSDKEFNALSPNQVRDLQLSMRHFFINYTQENLNGIIWEVYRAWVFNSAETVEGDEIKAMLLFYETMLDFMKDVHNYCQHFDQTVLKDD